MWEGVQYTVYVDCRRAVVVVVRVVEGVRLWHRGGEESLLLYFGGGGRLRNGCGEPHLCGQLPNQHTSKPVYFSYDVVGNTVLCEPNMYP